jgi:MEMO1 family protein
VSGAEIVRPPAVAGLFYPDEPKELAETVDEYLDAAQSRAPQTSLGNGRLVALICPHAGYRYSGPVAASAYRLLRGQSFRRVVVLSPSHRVAFRGLALPDCDAFETPLGRVPLWPGCRDLSERPPFVLDPRPHAAEHAVEVHLPFLQRTLGQFELVPIVFGASDRVVSHSPLLPLVNAETLWVISTDLSHYLTYDAACEVDRGTLSAILARDPERVVLSDACGRGPTATLLGLARELGWQIQLLDYRNSGDTAGDRGRVVGYAALALTDPARA